MTEASQTLSDLGQPDSFDQFFDDRVGEGNATSGPDAPAHAKASFVEKANEVEIKGLKAVIHLAALEVGRPLCRPLADMF